jgi:hypothetical protein
MALSQDIATLLHSGGVVRKVSVNKQLGEFLQQRRENISYTWWNLAVGLRVPNSIEGWVGVREDLLPLPAFPAAPAFASLSTRWV